jgi:predicted TIM-barrel fold metal-dependent hydrolase
LTLLDGVSYARKTNDRLMRGSPTVIIDAWMNLNEPGATEGFASDAHNSALMRQFHRQAASLTAGEEPADMIAEMDRHDVRAGLLTTLPVVDRGGYEKECEALALVSERFPGRFGLAPLLPRAMGMEAVRAVDHAAEIGSVGVRVMPALVGEAPDHRSYYPVYTRCVQLGLPITINVGLPGPALPAAVQDPIHLDQVCRDFPELIVVATHMGWPWTEVLIGLSQRHENLFIMTSAWAPEYYPAEMVRYLTSRGRGKVMFASDHPLVPLKRAIPGVASFDMSDEARQAFMFDTANRVFFQNSITAA